MKQRIWVWIVLIVLTFGGNSLFQLFSAPKDIVNIKYDVYESPELSNLRDFKIFRSETNYNVGGTNVIFSKENKDIEGFKKYDNFLTSPFVMFVGNHALEENSGFIVHDLDSDRSYRSVEKNLSNILLGMEKNQTWQDIGINKDVLEGPIKLVIPNKESPYYSLVKELFLINLNENITEENIDELLDRVNSLMGKCEQVDDVSNYIEQNDSKKEMSKIAVIAPEYIMAESYNVYTGEHSSSKQTFTIPVYLTKTVSVDYHLYIKNDVTEELCNKILDKYGSKKMLTSTGLRPLYKNVNVQSLNTYTITDVNIVKLEPNIKEKIVNHSTTVIGSAEAEPITASNEEKVEVENMTEENDSLTVVDWIFIIIGIIIGLIFIIMLCCFAFEM